MIIHQKDSAWQLDEYKIDEEGKSVSGIRKSLPAERLSYKIIRQDKDAHKISCNPNPYDELHLYINEFTSDSCGRTVLAHQNLGHIEVYRELTVLRLILRGFLMLLFILVLIALLLAPILKLLID
jgi:hypothetical protein